MSTSFSLSSAVRFGIAAAAVAGSCVAVAAAQTPDIAAGASQPVNFNFAPPRVTVPAADALFSDSSSSDSTVGSAADAIQTNLFSLEKNFAVPGLDAQYGRRRYGAPRYRGSNTNADGSEKYTFYGGAGFGSPVGDNSNYLTTSYGFQVGAGRNFNRHLGLNVEFDYDHFGLTGQTLSNQSAIYFNGDTNPADNGLDGTNHIWSFSVQPIYQIYSGEGLGAYITGGVGFYHKVTNFTTPQAEEFLSYFGPEEVYVNATLDHYTSNAPGFDGGLGLTYKFSRFANERLYAEVRFVHIDNSYRSGLNADNESTYAGSNFFPQNSQTTSYIPIKFGVRF